MTVCDLFAGTSIMVSIKLKALNFEAPPFRKLNGLTIKIAERITLIAGHNGIGKSTILGLIANGSGIGRVKFQSYLNRPFEANLNEIVHLDYAKEYEAYKSSDSPMPSPLIEYEIDGTSLIKRSSITSREGREIRVVPRNNPYKEALFEESDIQVGKDAKVPLPTLYLGMTRMLPVGESNPAWVVSDLDKTIHPDDALFIKTFISKVIATELRERESKSITTQGIRGTRKTAKHPDYSYSAKCISLGQDSLSAIATALASFKKLQREWPNYPGGLLVVDELDAGFHPHAQQQLVKAIANAARTLRLQVIATTHSMRLIEAIHPEGNPVGPGGRHTDSVIYLVDTRRPRVADDYTLESIRCDMSLTPPPAALPTKAKTLKIYLEDFEAGFILKRLLTTSLKKQIKQATGFNVKPIHLNLGCENLKGLHKQDPYFLSVLIALDADAKLDGLKRQSKNVVRLPGASDRSGHGLSPERTLHKFIEGLVNSPEKFPTADSILQKNGITSDFLQAHLLDGDSNMENRQSAKKWMNEKLPHIERWDIVGLWMKEHESKVKDFEIALVKAAIATAKQRDQYHV